MSPDKVTLVRLYCAHREFFYLEYFQNFKLFVSWYLQEPIERGYEICPAKANLPWYHGSWELTELAKILKCTEREVLGTIEEIYDDY